MNGPAKSDAGTAPGRAFRAARIASIPLLGRVARRLARCYREGSVTRIKTGAGKGMLWKRSHRYQSGFFLGTYEPLVQDFLAARLRKGSVFWDVGANAGFFSLIGSNLVGGKGRVIAFEPFPESARSIREQIRLNGLEDTCEVVEAAVSSRVGHSNLLITDHNAMHRLDSDGGIRVATISLDSVIDEGSGNSLPELIKVDVEGAELEVMAGAEQLLGSGTTWLVEAHGQAIESRLRELFEESGYSVSELGDRDIENKVLLAAEPRQV